MLGSAERGAMNAEQVIRIALTVITPILTAGIGIVALVIGTGANDGVKAGRRKGGLRRCQQDRSLSPAEGGGTPASCLPTIPRAGEERAATPTRLGRTKSLRASSPNPTLHQFTKAGYHASSIASRLPDATPRRKNPSGRLLFLRRSRWFFKVSSAMGAAMGRSDTIGIPNYFSGGSSTPTSSPYVS